MMAMRTYRGLGDLTINNPGNIEKSTGVKWNGEYSCSRPRFACFETMPQGYRAMFLLLRNYITQHKANTIGKMISRWAPSSENDTNGYISFVEKQSGINRNTVINENDIDSLTKIVSAMSHMENGAKAVAKDVEAGRELAKERFGAYVKTGIGVLGIIGIGAAIYFIVKKTEE